MNLIENVKMAFSSVLAHKMRSILTMLGIIIGVASVIVVVAIGQGGEQMIKSTIVGEGNTIEVMYQPSEEELQSNPNAYFLDAFTQEDINALKEIEGVKHVVGMTTSFESSRYKEEQFDLTLYAINDAYLRVNDLDFVEGRNLTSADFLGGRRVGVISAEIKKEYFPNSSPIGEIIWVGKEPMEVIGVLEEPTGLLAFGANEMYLPFSTYRQAFGQNNFNQVTIQTETADDLQVVGEEATALLNRLHNTEDSYQVFNLEELADSIGQITTIMTSIIGSIAGVSLLVGGIGVMNIMLVSVTERTREIGIRKALGATRQQILTQFLIESMTLTLIGGLLGILLGAVAANLVSFFADWPSLISWVVVVGAVVFSMVIGIVFGMLPANKAAKLDPIDALRYE
ncbi:ABC transporter permease [Bacillus coahuilensis]|uniref:ABC transporter permease n=1 Tax=Bacillus coahuilensis TaxID=408580 RepID=UPI00018511E1|nr:ABC transporter permease [Bacillus coahuilensis]